MPMPNKSFKKGPPRPAGGRDDGGGRPSDGALRAGRSAVSVSTG